MTLKPWAIALAGIAAAALLLGSGAQAGSVLSANLYGDGVVGGGAGKQAYGDFNGYAEPEDGSLCYYLEVAGVGEVTSAHIHLGDAGENGREIVTLQIADVDEVCAEGEGETIKAMLARPDRYYVDIHTGDHPRGALRGQLSG